MDSKFNKMSYKEFRNYCVERTCDGKWGMVEAITCINAINFIDNIKIKWWFGLINKKKTLSVREKAWKDYVLLKQ